jgi:hypothetical protein
MEPYDDPEDEPEDTDSEDQPVDLDEAWFDDRFRIMHWDP